MWVYRPGFMYQDQQIILYEYQKTRNTFHTRSFLKDWEMIDTVNGANSSGIIYSISESPKLQMINSAAAKVVLYLSRYLCSTVCDLLEFWANSDKAQEVLGWKPVRSLEDMCRDT